MLEIMKPLCLMACLLFAVGGQSIAETIKPPPPGLKKKFQAVHGVVESARTSNKAYIREQLRVIENLSLTAAERYENFANKYPQIIQQVTQKQIATYLGITPEFLSTIRSKRANR